MRIAIVGSGIAGLGCAWLLHKQGHDVTLFEAGPALGGHTHTVDVTLDGVTHPVDTGFLVFNDRTYPRLIALFDELGVRSVRERDVVLGRVDDAERLEWAGTEPRARCSRSRATRCGRASGRMLADILRFNRETTAMLADGDAAGAARSASSSSCGGYGAPLSRLVPAADGSGDLVVAAARDPRLPVARPSCASATTTACWRSATARSGAPFDGGWSRLCRASLARASRRPAVPARCCACSGVPRAWRSTPTGASASASTAWCSRATATRRSRCSHDPSQDEHRLLSAVRYQRNRVVLHTDPALLPRRRARVVGLELPGSRRRRRRASRRGVVPDQQAPAAAVRTPGGRDAQPAVRARDPRLALREFEYDHPVLDRRCGRGAARASPRCRASATRGSPARGCATASTRTASTRRISSRTRIAAPDAWRPTRRSGSRPDGDALPRVLPDAPALVDRPGHASRARAPRPTRSTIRRSACACRLRALGDLPSLGHRLQRCGARIVPRPRPRPA